MKKRTVGLVQILVFLVLGGVAVFVCYAIPMVGFGSMLSGLSCPDGKASAADLAHLVRGTFPPSLSNIDTLQVGGAAKYCEVYLRFEMAPTDLNTFVLSTRINLPLVPKTHLHLFDSLHGKNPWKPDPATTYLYGRGPQSLDYTQTVFVDTTYPQRYIIYMIVEYESF